MKSARYTEIIRSNYRNLFKLNFGICDDCNLFRVFCTKLDPKKKKLHYFLMNVPIIGRSRQSTIAQQLASK